VGYYARMETPKKEKIKISFVYPKDLIDALRVLAQEHQRSLVGEIVWALRQYLARQSPEKE